jgi:nitrogenase-associated protein
MHIIFYEKPGCGGNAKQRALLEAAGHTLERRSLLDTAWTADSLMAFLKPLPVAQWFNRAAPRVKQGEVVPEALQADAALALLLADHLLIRRPLMQTPDGTRLVGFDADEVGRVLGLPGQAVSSSAPGSLEGCAAASPQATCRTQA